MGSYDTRPARLTVSSRLAKLSKSRRFMTCGRLYFCETLLEGLAQHLQDMAAALRQLIQQEHAVVRQRHLRWHRHLAPPVRPTSEMVWWRRDMGALWLRQCSRR
jgi:hypothetical protein